MKQVLCLLLLCASHISAMDATHALGYDAIDISVENRCTYPIEVIFDAAMLKKECTLNAYTVQQMQLGDPSVVHILEAHTRRETHFLQLVEYKNGINTVLSKLRAYISFAGKQDPIPYCYSLDLNPDSEKQRLIITPGDHGPIATVDVTPNNQ